MERVVVRHLSGSRANQVEEFPLSTVSELLLGREPGASIRFDPERDDLVGRQHARIARDPADPYKFTIADLNSRNGTFLNRQRVTGPVALSPGDVIQLGPAGPELQFDLDPLPAHLVKGTRIASGAAVLPATREAGLPSVAAAAAPLEQPARTAVGKATVERLVTEARSDARRSMYSTVAIVGVVLVAGIATLAWQWNRRAQTLETTASTLVDAERRKPWTAEMIAANFTESTVFIEVGWKLVLAGRGEQIYHEYVVPTDDQGRPAKDEQGRRAQPMPIYVQLSDGSIEPSLTLERGQFSENVPIGGMHTGSGFVVTTDGFILTNRHVAATWETSYTDFPQRPGVLVNLANPKEKPSILEQPPRGWVPAAAKVIGRAVQGKNVEGSLTYLDVTFAKNKLRFPAKISRVSDTHDVAMIKIDTPQPVTKVELLDNYSAVKVGQAITVMGYPAISPLVAVRTLSDDPFSRDPQVRTVPDPTVTPGSIGRVIRGQLRPASGQVSDYVSTFGDAYQLGVSTTGGGNSGGPVFDDHGHVIAIYTSGAADLQSATRISFAVPIRYGIELMGTKPVI